MKVAVFSDVQGNLPAMDAAVEHVQAWLPDLVIMAGDLINRGPSSGACLARFQSLRDSQGWLPVRGNHEDWVLRCGRERPVSPLDADMRRFADFAFAQIAGSEEGIGEWPDHLCFEGTGSSGWVHVTHGTLAGNRDGISASVSDEALDGKLPQDIDVFVTAHTHKPLIRPFGDTVIVNVGSVGSPFDGDVRASYGRLELRGGRWHPRIIRLDYDREAAERAFADSGFLDQGGPLARIIHEEWRSARLLMPYWRKRYSSAVRTSEITLEQSVDAFLRSVNE
jgi:putative phosphoesterase